MMAIDQYMLRDPREAYPKPEFSDQPQPHPGSTEQMQPRPDHGEQTYRGSARLAGQPAELAPVYVFLASQEPSYVNGAPIAVTGGTQVP